MLGITSWCGGDRELQIWLDGKVIVAAYFYGRPMSPTPLLVGRRNPHDGRSLDLDGQLDDVGIWNRALSDDEIAYLYHGGQGHPVRPPRDSVVTVC